MICVIIYSNKSSLAKTFTSDGMTSNDGKVSTLAPYISAKINLDSDGDSQFQLIKTIKCPTMNFEFKTKMMMNEHHLEDNL